jgi:hypothetical protein
MNKDLCLSNPQDPGRPMSLNSNDALNLMRMSALLSRQEGTLFTRVIKLLLLIKVAPRQFGSCALKLIQ